MPNWCENAGRIIAPYEDAALDFERELKAGNLFNFYLPIEVDETSLDARGFPNWYVNRCTLWGVKWDIDPQQASVTRDGCTLHFDFYTAWQPPLAFYAYLAAQGFEVTAGYFEGGMMFGGRWTAGSHERWDCDREALTPESLPDYLYDAFGADAFAWLFDQDEDCECDACSGEDAHG